ncbi:MAG: DUF6145 family protein [Lachnospiraceae bacterium]|jgi:hypothetical protein|uniref:DUF6145 family protein n=1 Tax=Kineothrix sp. MSJ-39 TaxID=2841533 RepID=UPI0003407802|nr:DUF6145 family protein [Kineothrix sp. MSJ-39]MCI6034496.1 DUF6145 family protein [Bacillota bacterium]MDY3769745.1 DUF6145 family protein [Lachnospiraceae bacterium]CCZ28243.1 putative uncharacterized protein [Firmicutes bacterium CAG:194]MDD6696145.1 DUF6145 family protein [Bacillota bacterium]MEE1437872.1 DUF6145 family protein [Lachnospiraceae bacterium]
MAMSDLQMKDRMADGRIVLCGSNAYEKKYYFNPLFDSVPESVKEELHIICVLFTEEAGGVFLIVFEPDGSISMETEAAEEDILYDDITAGLLVSEIRRHRQTLFEELQLFYRVFVLKEDITLEDET